MARERKDVPTQPGAAVGSKGVNVERLQEYLERFGYIRSDAHTEFGVSAEGAAPRPAQPGEFDEATEEALKKFQAFHGLEVTGVLDPAIIELMGSRRCGDPDDPRAASQQATGGNYVLQGNKWGQMNLTYGFQEMTGDLSDSQVRSAVSTALGYWAAVTPLTFSEVASNPDIIIRFVTGDHGDGSAFDGGGGVLAHAFYPGQGAISGDSHFDDAETWTVNVPPSGIDLVTVAAHEFGHALGLAHSTVSQALMYPYYGGPHRYLHQDDVDGIQALYGAQQWYTKLCLSIFATYHSKNAWCFIQDVGWRKIRPTTADGVTNMLAAATEARANGMPVTVQATGSELLQLYL